jgi:hypothetical protein
MAKNTNKQKESVQIHSNQKSNNPFVIERVKIPGTHYKISSTDHQAIQTLGACRSDRKQVSRVQMKSWAEWALEKLNRLEQCKV